MCFSVYAVQTLSEIESRFGAKPFKAAFDAYERRSQADPKRFKPMLENAQIFPNYWAPIIIKSNDERVILPMRYRLRPAGSTEEVPSKFNLFNARFDSLQSRETWSRIYMKNHGILAFNKFYEWVEDKDSKKKKLICFSPRAKDLMWSPVLYDIAKDEGGRALFSFALITNDPPAEVLEAGHDRCPIFLKEEHIDTWLSPQNRTVKDIQEVLLDKPQVFYEHSDAA